MPYATRFKIVANDVLKPLPKSYFVLVSLIILQETKLNIGEANRDALPPRDEGVYHHTIR